MEQIIERNKNLSWNDLSGVLKPNRSRASTIRQAMLVGKLVWKKVYPFHIIQPLIRAGWRFVQDQKIEDVGANRFLFTFQSVEEKDSVLAQGP